MGLIFNIQRYCLHDGDGIRTTVFFAGCPFRCVWCHNPEGQMAKPVLLFSEHLCTGCGACLPCPARSLKNGRMVLDRSCCTGCGACATACKTGASRFSGHEASAAEVFETVLRDRAYYACSGGGMTLSGGEPAAQGAFALELLQLARDAGISAVLETAGGGTEAFYRDTAALGTTFYYDLKCMTPALHQTLVGAPLQKVLTNLELLFSLGAPVVLRMPLIPGLNDGKAETDRLCAYLTAHRASFQFAEIMPYHPLGSGKARALARTDLYTAPAATRADAEAFRQKLLPCGAEIRISDSGLL